MDRKIYANIGAEIWISTMLKILKNKGLIKDGELEEAFAQSLKEYHEGKFVSIVIKEKETEGVKSNSSHD